MAVSLQQLRYFLAVVEEGQITAAARRLHLAQPALSQAIGALERDLGTALLVRGRHGVVPTEAGERFAAKAREAVEAVDAAVAAVRREQAGRLVLGVLPGMPIDGLLAGFRTAFPEVRLLLRLVSFATELSAVRDGDVDIAFVFPRYPEPTVAYVPIARIPAVVYCGWDTVYAREPALRFDQIALETFPGQHPSVPDEFVDLFNLTAHRGQRPETVEAPTTIAEALELFVGGRAIAAGPSGMRHPAPSPVATVPLAGIDPFELSLIHRRANTAAAVAAFVGYAQTFTQVWAHDAAAL